MDNTQSLGAIINKTHMKMKNNIARELKPYNITPEQWIILNRLWKQDGISQKELAKRCFKDQPTTARILDKLEKRGFINRKANPDDKRAFLIYLTDIERDIEKKLIEAGNKHSQQILKNLSENDQNKLKELLNIIIDNLE